MNNANLFGLALDRHQSNMLAAFEASESAAEARDECIGDRAQALMMQLAFTPEGKTCPRAFDEAIGDLCIRPAFMAELAALKDAGDEAGIGRKISEWFDEYWNRRSVELAEEQDEKDAEKARQDAMAEALL